ncbi:MAG: VCBS repeat-containing protein [Reichenbachiella sp.]
MLGTKNTSLVLTAFFLIALSFWGCQDNSQKSQLSKKSEKLFKLISSEESGITFSNRVVENYANFFEFFMYLYNGGGVALGDINADGLPDIYFTGNEISNKLYLNKGDLKFEDITEKAGVAGDKNWSNGVSMIDINNDGLQDIYICKGGWQDTAEDRKNILYINQGDLTFKNEAAKYGLDDTGYSIQATFFDADNDNDLDIYLINRPDSFALPIAKSSIRRFDPPEDSRDKLYINYDGKYLEEGQKRGMGENYGYGLSAVAADINGDDFIDIFVSNDFSIEDYFYINQGDGTFQQKIKEATNHISLYSMGTDITDINNDGMEDIVVMDMRPSDYVRSKVSMPSMDTKSFYGMIDNGMHPQYMHNMLYLNQGNTFFSDISQFSGMSKTDWSWSVLSSDMDQDGYRDLFITNGMKRDLFDKDVKIRMRQYIEANRHKYKTAQALFDEGFTGLIESYKPIRINNYLMKNTGKYDYQDVSTNWGFDQASLSNGAAIGDLDNDGDLDLVINNFDEPAFLYENTGKNAGNSTLLDLNGPNTNIDGLGAKVTIYHDGKTQYFQNKTTRGYLSSSDNRVHFGIGNSQKLDSIIVQWTDGKQTIKTNQGIEEPIKISYHDAKEILPSSEKYAFLFSVATPSETPLFKHHENSFNEYEKQVLLPHEFSKNGPFLAVGDLNGDEQEDFFIGGAAGQAGQIFMQSNGRFIKKPSSLLTKDNAFEDMDASMVDMDGDGDHDLVIASGGAEFAPGHKLYQDRIYFNDGDGNFTKRIFLPSKSSASCIAPNDIDGDGDFDLFIGGQVIADQYLDLPESYLYINENGTLVDKTAELSQLLKNCGMVYSATWADLYGDTSKELIVVGEWMPILIFTYQDGKFKEISRSLGLDKTEGWWQSVTANDLDQDGDMDLIIGNQGQNYKFKASVEKPFEIFTGDFDKNGTNDIFLAKHSNKKILPIRGKECTIQQMPVISEKFSTFESFAYADLSQIIGAEIQHATRKQAYQFSSIILENKKGKLIVHELPPEAQFSTIQGIHVDDFDSDGIQDILIAGNKFDVEIETTPADASPGYFLKGKGNMQFEAIHPSVSGLLIPDNIKDIQMIVVGDETKILISINDQAMKLLDINK